MSKLKSKIIGNQVWTVENLTSGTYDKTGLAVRLVMDLQSPRIEDDIEYV